MGVTVAEWVQTWVETSHLQVQEIPGRGRGLVASREIHKGELLLKIPSNLIFTKQRFVESLPEYQNRSFL